MNDLLRTMIASKGYDTHDFTMLYYGGAGPVHMYGFAEGIEFKDIITIPWAAGFSAFGAACAEYMHRYDRGTRALIPNQSDDEHLAKIAKDIHTTWREMEHEARTQMKAEGIDPATVTFRYGVSARYMGQIESFNTALENGVMDGPNDIQTMIAAFETMYSKVYPEGAKFGSAGYSLTDIHLEAIADKPQPKLLRHELSNPEPDPSAFVEKRDVYHKDRWVSFNVWEMGELKAGNTVKGPSIIRDPMTTVVIPPNKKMYIDEYLILHYS